MALRRRELVARQVVLDPAHAFGGGKTRQQFGARDGKRQEIVHPGGKPRSHPVIAAVGRQQQEIAVMRPRPRAEVAAQVQPRHVGQGRRGQKDVGLAGIDGSQGIGAGIDQRAIDPRRVQQVGQRLAADPVRPRKQGLPSQRGWRGRLGA